MRIFKIKAFDYWARKIKLHDELLIRSVIEIERGLYEVRMGGYLYKKRIGLGHRGKSGGIRTIIAYKQGNKALFIYGFSKSQKANITSMELDALKKLSKLYFEYSNEQIEKIIKIKEIIEVK